MAFKSDQSRFAYAPQVNINRSGFDRTTTHTTTMNSGFLVPFFVDEVLPGDTFKANCSLFARMLTPIVPFMDNLYLDTHFFFVPSRLVWEHWENMHGARKNPDDSVDYVCPTITFPDGVDYESVFDYMGVPPGVPVKVNALPFRAYALIWNECFRDANLQDETDLNLGDGGDTPDTYKLLRRGKRKDYFTSALPWPVQNGEGVDVPLLGDFSPVVMGKAGVLTSTNQGTTYTSIGDDDIYMNGQPARLARGVSSPYMRLEASEAEVVQNGVNSLAQGQMAGLYADLRTTAVVSINRLREAFQLQRLLERDARGGSNRYTSMLQAHFGVINPDQRLQRPEYLGSGSTPLSVFAVPQTSSSSSDSPQGNLAAYATAGDSSHAFTRSFTEFGYIIGLASIRADLHYQQGLRKMFFRSGRFDYYYPANAHLGEQAILNKEIYLQGNAQDEDVFGYQERWAEYRYFPSMVTGKLRSSYPQSLDYWHLAQQFGNLPTLSAEFIEENPPVSRVVAVQDEPEFKLDSLMRLKCWRPMPLYSVPGLIDHF